MGRLLADPDLRRRMGEAGRALVRREFSLDAMVEGNLAVYRSLA
jgi:glycosyltransferase involved in cell wall biosynthesis